MNICGTDQGNLIIFNRNPDKKMAYRMFIYMANIWEQYFKQFGEEKPIPLILPIVFYQGKAKWNSPLTLHSLINPPSYLKPYIPDFCYALYDLSELSDNNIRGKIAYKLAMFLLKYIDDPNINEIINQKAKPLIIELLQQKTGLEYIYQMLYYLGNASNHMDKEEIIEFFDNISSSEETREVIMTAAQQWREEGREEGMEEGHLLGKSGVIKKLLTLKFGDNASLYFGKLKEFNVDELDKIAERILTASNVEDIFS